MSAGGAPHVPQLDDVSQPRMSAGLWWALQPLEPEPARGAEPLPHPRQLEEGVELPRPISVAPQLVLVSVAPNPNRIARLGGGGGIVVSRFPSSIHDVYCLMYAVPHAGHASFPDVPDQKDVLPCGSIPKGFNRPRLWKYSTYSTQKR